MKRHGKQLFSSSPRGAGIALGLFAVLLANHAAADFTPVAGWDRHLFPAYIVATATFRPPPDDKPGVQAIPTFGDAKGLLGVMIRSPDDGAVVKVTIASDSIFDPSTVTAALPKKGVQYKICPPIKYNYAALARNKQAVPATVTYRVEVSGKEPEEKSVTVTLRSINDCPITYDEGNETTDVSFVFAAYVNEEHPLVDKILREALNAGIAESFHGYGDEKDAEDVLRQVYALWHALSQRGVRYSDITATAAESEAVNSQHVRLLEETINNAQANCVDGSVLLASLLRKIGIEPFLVIVPGHCHLGFYLDEQQTKSLAIETTLIGSTPDANDSREIKNFKKVVEERWTKTASWATFVAALSEGTSVLRENKAKFESDDHADYQIIPIAETRQSGILPIAFAVGQKE